MSLFENQPVPCAHDTPRTCVHCGNAIVPKELAYMDLSLQGAATNHYHTRCLVRAQWEALNRLHKMRGERQERYSRLESEVAHWKGNARNAQAQLRLLTHPTPPPEPTP